ncbi:helix-turn-helix domain-containing protein [Clostridium paraputrificum]|uniref:helix-turn-helix domain-containing protein n=1 Tax=Clostridium paraputrificum TaxID=29363 RepID=UPI003D356C6F
MYKTKSFNDTELYTVAEVAKKFKTNTDYVYALIKRGHLKVLKLGSFKIRLDRFINYAEGKDFTNLDNITELQY